MGIYIYYIQVTNESQNNNHKQTTGVLNKLIGLKAISENYLGFLIDEVLLLLFGDVWGEENEKRKMECENKCKAKTFFSRSR